MIYLAQPYSHRSGRVKEYRYQAALYAMTILMEEGQEVFSPILHCHHLATNLGCSGSWEKWAAFDEWALTACESLYVLQIPGFEKSVGLAAEEEIMNNQGKPVIPLDKRYNLPCPHRHTWLDMLTLSHICEDCDQQIMDDVHHAT